MWLVGEIQTENLRMKRTLTPSPGWGARFAERALVRRVVCSCPPSPPPELLGCRGRSSESNGTAAVASIGAAACEPEKPGGHTELPIGPSSDRPVGPVVACRSLPTDRVANIVMSDGGVVAAFAARLDLEVRGRTLHESTRGLQEVGELVAFHQDEVLARPHARRDGSVVDRPSVWLAARTELM